MPSGSQADTRSWYIRCLGLLNAREIDGVLQAGFAELGEMIESSVAREVAEESSITIDRESGKYKHDSRPLS